MYLKIEIIISINIDDWTDRYSWWDLFIFLIVELKSIVDGSDMHNWWGSYDHVYIWCGCCSDTYSWSIDRIHIVDGADMFS